MKHTLAVILSALLVTASFSGCYGLQFLRELTDENGEDYEEDMTAFYPDSFPEIDDYPANTIPVPEITEVQTVPKIQEVDVRPAEWAAVQWEAYSSPYFTLQIPSGWQVEWQGDANQLAWRAVSPDGKIGFFNQDHAYAAKDASMASTLGFSMSLSEGMVQEYFETMYKDTTDYFTVQNSCVPNNKDVIQAIRPYTPIRDYQALYATFKENGWEGEGVYSAVIMDSKDVVIRGFKGRCHKRVQLRSVGDQLYLYPVGACGQLSQLGARHRHDSKVIPIHRLLYPAVAANRAVGDGTEIHRKR